MEELPHHYIVSSSASSEGSVLVEAVGLPSLETAPPAEFGGPGDKWSPESLLVAAVADCFILTFRAIARASPAAFPPQLDSSVAAANANNRGADT